EEAALNIAKHHLVGIAEGRSTLASGLSALQKEMRWGWDPYRDELATSSGCQEILDLFVNRYDGRSFYNIEPDENTPEMQNLEGAVRPLICQWVRDRCGVPFEPGWRTSTVNEIAHAIATE